jgi:hypothetical protein
MPGVARTSTSAASITGRVRRDRRDGQRAAARPATPVTDGEHGDVGQVVAAADRREVLAGRQEPPHGGPFGERERRPHLEGEVAGGDGESPLARGLDHAGQDLVPRGAASFARRWTAATVLVLEDDPRASVQVSRGAPGVADDVGARLGPR